MAVRQAVRLRKIGARKTHGPGAARRLRFVTRVRGVLMRAVVPTRLVLLSVLTLCFAFAGSAACATPTYAEASASDRATARALANQGYSALKNKDYATAEDRFLRADELVHAPTLVLDHGRALLGLGRIGEAYAAFDSVAHEVLPPNPLAVWK